jgi:hypothetical protein
MRAGAVRPNGPRVPILRPGVVMWRNPYGLPTAKIRSPFRSRLLATPFLEKPDFKPSVRLLIIPKTQLSAYQLAQATRRIFAPEHASDVGPQHFWRRPEHDGRHLVLFDRDSEEFVGTVSCHITPPVVQDFTWWLDSRMRKKGYWRPLADDLAAYLRTRHQIERIGFIVFGRGHRAASEKIAKRLREHFEKKP